MNCQSDDESSPSDREQIEQALRESEERYALAMRASSEALWDWDLRTGKAHVSPHFEKLYGVTTEELKTPVSAMTPRVHPEDLPRLKQAQQAHFDGRYTVRQRVVRFPCDRRAQVLVEREKLEHDRRSRPRRTDNEDRAFDRLLENLWALRPGLMKP